MRYVKQKALLATVLLIGLICRPGLGQLTIYDWIATEDVANWNEAANWNSSFGNEVPDADRFDGEAALINNGGTALVSEAVPKVSNLEIRNGVVDVADGGVLQTVVDNSGSGALTVGGAGSVAMSGSGSLTVAGDVSNSGRIQLAGPAVSFSIAGDFLTSGALVAGLEGGNLASFSVEGAATLGGSLGIDIGDSEPAFGQTWDLLSAQSIAGQFSSVNTIGSAAAPRGLQYQVVTSDTTATVKVGNALVATIDRQSGAGKLANVFGGPVELTSYALRSNNGLLVDAWDGVLGEGWTSSNAGGTHVAELNLDGSRTVNVGDAIDLGSPYAAALIARSDEDVVLQYTTADGQLVNGIVEYTGGINDVVLYVDPADGSAAIANLSRFLEAPDVTSYAILSEAGSLLGSWTGLAESGQAGDGWTKANPTANHIAELNLDDSIVLDNGTVLSLGKVLADGAAQDLQFLYTTAAGDQLNGTVEYSAVPTTSNLLGDCNQDGQLTAADLDCIGTIEQRDAVLGALNTLPGDLDGNGDVSFADFLKLSGNFGDDSKTRYSDGNVDLQAGVAFADFLALSGNFGQVPAGARAVPEPGAWGSWLVALMMLTISRRRKRS